MECRHFWAQQSLLRVVQLSGSVNTYLLAKYDCACQKGFDVRHHSGRSLIEKGRCKI